MKKGLLRALSAVVAISMLFCMSMVAFADVTTTASITTYAGNTVTVKTTVNGAVPSEQVAFLVEKGADIVWIDQQPANASGYAESTFTAAAANAVGASVKVGTSSIAASEATTDTIEVASYTVAWTVNSAAGSKVVAYVNDVEDNDGTATVTQDVAEITFYVFPVASEELVTINGEKPEVIGNAFTMAVNANASYEFAFAAKTIAEDAVTTATKGDVATYTAATKKASVAATAANATEFGIVVAKEGYDFSAIDFASIATDGGEGVEVIKLAALGANAEGQFVIVIDDADSTFFVEGAKYVAQVYAVNNGVPALSGEAFALN